jgi:hypothetical protein
MPRISVSESGPTAAQTPSTSAHPPSEKTGASPSGNFGLGDAGQRVEHVAHRRVIQPEIIEEDRADQGVGRDIAVTRVGGDHCSVRDLRGCQGRHVPRSVNEGAVA